MKVTKLGFSFKYHGDEILRYWPWVKRSSSTVYRSELYSRDFNSFNEYWRMVGEETSIIKSIFGQNKIGGFNFKEVLGFWSSKLWVGEYIVVLMSVNPAMKGPSFWSRLTAKQRDSLLQDVVVLRCNDRKEMESLIDSIDVSFAEAYGILSGKVILTNDLVLKDSV